MRGDIHNSLQKSFFPERLISVFSNLLNNHESRFICDNNRYRFFGNHFICLFLPRKNERKKIEKDKERKQTIS